MEIDSDGDVILDRRRRAPAARSHDGDREDRGVLSEVHLRIAPQHERYHTTTFHTQDGDPLVSLRHALATPLSHVGLQVRRRRRE
jgi:hypothetical protein